jgi:hypothetical protein
LRTIVIELGKGLAVVEQATQAATPEQASRKRRSSMKSKAATSGLYVDQDAGELTNGQSDV